MSCPVLFSEQTGGAFEDGIASRVYAFEDCEDCTSFIIAGV